ncbi:MAG TPA: type VI secretion system baseplate subunit TssE [Thermoanaerobaculia bacterium]|nr:type VI secretion system baseplate subunit TssE [Thermoanaerobaculia bacterium]
MAWRSTEDGFLERMLAPLPGRPASPIRWVGDPVRTHLALLLNTRQGALQNLPDYGLPDVSSFYSDYPASLGELRALIERLVRKYEPRLLSPRVRLVGSDAREFRVSFLITGEIEVDEEKMTRVQYRTTISSSGHAAVGADLDDV